MQKYFDLPQHLWKIIVPLMIAMVSVLQLQAQPLPNVNGEVFCTLLSKDGGTLYVGGNFKGSDVSLNWSLLAIDVATGQSKWKNTVRVIEANENGNDHAGIVYALAEGENNEIFIGGKFGGIYDANGLQKNAGIAKINGNDGSLLPWDLTFTKSETVYALQILRKTKISSQQLCIGGDFTYFSNISNNEFVGLLIVDTDGGSLGVTPKFYFNTGIGTPKPGTIKAIKVSDYYDPLHMELLVGGQFNQFIRRGKSFKEFPIETKNWNFAWFEILYGGPDPNNDNIWSLVPERQISFWNGSYGDPIPMINTIAVRKNLLAETEVFVGGVFFSAINLYPNTKVPIYTGTSFAVINRTKGLIDWSPFFAINAKDYPAVNALAFTENLTKLVVGGNFELISGNTRTKTALFDLSTLSTPIPQLQAWNIAITNPNEPNPLATRVNALSAVGSNVAIGGNFTQANALPRKNLVMANFSGNGSPFAVNHSNDEASVAAVANTTLEAGLRIFPNPVSETMQITLPERVPSEVRVLLLNTLGAAVMETRISGTGGEVNLRGLSAGAYTVEVSAGTQRWVKRIVKQ